MSANPTLNPYNYTAPRAGSLTATATTTAHKALDTAFEAVRMGIDWRSTLATLHLEGVPPTEITSAKFLVWETFSIAEDALAEMRAQQL